MKSGTLVVVSVLLVSSLRADVVTIGASKDASIFQSNVNNSNGAGPGFYAGTNGTGSPRRALIAFDIVDNLPAGATITDVQLTLTLAQVAGSGGGSGSGSGTPVISLYALADAWGEGVTGASSTSLAGTGQGFAAGTGDATWNARFYSSTTPTAWTTPGGDHASSPSASLAMSSTTVGTTYTWLSTSQLIADVESWYANPFAAYGWEVINADETDPSTVFGFYSREWGTGATASTGDVSQQPKLQITYTVPEPSGLFLAAAALPALLRSRRRGSPH